MITPQDLSPEAKNLIESFKKSMADAMTLDSGEANKVLQAVLDRAIFGALEEWWLVRNRLPLTMEHIEEMALYKSVSALSDLLHRPHPGVHRGSSWSRSYCFFSAGIGKLLKKRQDFLKSQRPGEEHTIPDRTSKIKSEPPDPDGVYVFSNRAPIRLEVGQRWWLKHEDHQVVHAYEILSHTKHTIQVSEMYEAPDQGLVKLDPEVVFRYAISSLSFVEQIK